MTAPIVIELAASGAPADPVLARALVDACSAAAGAPGSESCVLDGEAHVAARARVVVSFSDADAHARIEVLVPIADTSMRSRNVSFRDDDPIVERYKAAGLIAAGLVSGLAPAEPTPDAAPEVAPATNAVRSSRRLVLVRSGAQAAWNGDRSWVGAELGADVSVAGPAFVALSGSYDQTWSRDSLGVAEQRSALGVGGGVAASLAGVELRVRVVVELQDLRASVRQPSTLREDAGDRTMPAVEGGVDLVLPIGRSLGVFAGVRGGWWGGETTVRVQGLKAEVVSGWMVSGALGLNIELP